MTDEEYDLAKEYYEKKTGKCFADLPIYKVDIWVEKVLCLYEKLLNENKN